MFAEYQPQQYVKLVANEDYFRGEPAIKEIFYRYIPSDAAAISRSRPVRST